MFKWSQIQLWILRDRVSDEREKSGEEKINRWDEVRCADPSRGQATSSVGEEWTYGRNNHTFPSFQALPCQNQENCIPLEPKKKKSAISVIRVTEHSEPITSQLQQWGLHPFRMLPSSSRGVLPQWHPRQTGDSWVEGQSDEGDHWRPMSSEQSGWEALLLGQGFAWHSTGPTKAPHASM